MNHKCPLCEYPCEREEDRRGRGYFFCTSCSFIFLDPSYRLNGKEERARYDLHNNSLENIGYVSWLNNFIDKAVTPYLEVGKTILDYGSGPTPVLSKLLQSRGYLVSIYDKYFQEEKPSGSYHMITSTEVIEHVADPLLFCRNLASLCAPNGYIALMTTFAPHSREKFLKWWYKEDTTHISFFTYENLQVIGRSLGWDEVFCDRKELIIFKN